MEGIASVKMIGSYQGLYTLTEDIGYKMQPNLRVTATGHRAVGKRLFRYLISSTS